MLTTGVDYSAAQALSIEYPSRAKQSGVQLAYVGVSAEVSTMLATNALQIVPVPFTQPGMDLLGRKFRNSVIMTRNLPNETGNSVFIYIFLFFLYYYYYYLKVG